MVTSIVLRQYKTITILVVLGLSLLFVTLFSLTVGAVSIPFSDAVVILCKSFGLFNDITIDDTFTVVMTSIRLPRVVMTLLIGAALGISGAALQGLFRNPLVEPSLIGVSGGSAAAVVVLIVFGSAVLPSVALWSYSVMLSLAAFAGGSAITFFVLKLSMDSGRTNMAALILIGVAVNALTGAIIGVAIFYANEQQMSMFLFWTLGDLGGATWDKLRIAAPALILSTVGLCFFAKPLNVLALGEAEAYHMGVHVEQTKRLMIFMAAAAVAVSVSLAGIIGFVGLIVPHLIRTIFYVDNTLVLPASALGGAFLLIIADIIARVVVAPAELPIGVVTALIGSPFFIMLLLKSKRKLQL
ncbi:FecCD family ABC transporter permease [Pseudochryseolinea flava]|uniref:Iron ABC transporter n=1 Tax=Pseudochryseolinea flava TaxID=2059302 RepID=A0A364Y7Y4_9BACT|nr:iron ABC transporter permease [Pseudochryseolinea flava]RAW02361.1 iron ABC transporter [Pseudochryseolinea flava]